MSYMGYIERGVMDAWVDERNGGEAGADRPCRAPRGARSGRDEAPGGGAKGAL